MPPKLHPLFRWRLGAGLSQEKAGERIGMRQQDWRRYEMGRVLPRREVLGRIEAVTGIAPVTIFKAWFEADDDPG